MIGILIGLVVGIGACEIIGRQLSGYSVVGQVRDWFRQLG